MIIYRRRSSPTNRAPGELPATKILWRNTAIAWLTCGWGLLALESLSSAQHTRWHSMYSFFARHFGADSLIAELSLALSEIPALLFHAALITCVIGGAFAGSFLLITSIVTTMHRSWQLEAQNASTEVSESN